MAIKRNIETQATRSLISVSKKINSINNSSSIATGVADDLDSSEIRLMIGLFKSALEVRIEIEESMAREAEELENRRLADIETLRAAIRQCSTVGRSEKEIDALVKDLMSTKSLTKKSKSARKPKNTPVVTKPDTEATSLGEHLSFSESEHSQPASQDSGVGYDI